MPSSKVLESKKAEVARLADKLKESCAGVFVSYKGITVSQDTVLRSELRKSGVEYIVVKNTLLKRAVEMVGLNGIVDVLKGTTAVALSKDDYVSAAKILCKFANDNDFYKIKAGFVDGNVINVGEINNLAKLPSKEVLMSQVLAGLNAPITGLVTVLSGTMKSLVVALDAIVKKKSA